MTSKGGRAGLKEKNLEAVLAELSDSRPDVADEVEALRAIFGESKLSLYASSSTTGSNTNDGS